ILLAASFSTRSLCSLASKVTIPPPGLSSRVGVSIFFPIRRRPVTSSSFLLVITLNLEPGSVDRANFTASTAPRTTTAADVPHSTLAAAVNASDCTSSVRDIYFLSNPCPVAAQPRHVIDRDRHGLFVDRPLPRVEGDDSVAPSEDHDLLQEPRLAHPQPEQHVAGEVEVAYDDLLPLREVE